MYFCRNLTINIARPLVVGTRDSARAGELASGASDRHKGQAARPAYYPIIRWLYREGLRVLAYDLLNQPRLADPIQPKNLLLEHAPGAVYHNNLNHSGRVLIIS